MYIDLSEVQAAGTTRNDRTTEYAEVKRRRGPNRRGGTSENAMGVSANKAADDAAGITNRTVGDGAEPCTTKVTPKSDSQEASRTTRCYGRELSGRTKVVSRSRPACR